MEVAAARASLLSAVRLVTLALKTRDRREPGRREKLDAEEQVSAWLRRYWRRQARLIRERLEAYDPTRKSLGAPPDTWFEAAFEDDEGLIAQLARHLQDAARDGVGLFGKRSKVQIDWTLTNSRAAEWAREYTYELVRGIDETTRDVLRRAVSGFVETPGMTIGDVMNALPFGEERARMVATTEITRVYAQAQQAAGEDLRREFPDVRVIKIWFTNNDDLVCEICGPLDGAETDVDSDFEGGISNPPAHPNCRCWTETTTALAEL